jgi:hypothetical protein
LKWGSHRREHNAACSERKCAGQRATSARCRNLSMPASAGSVLGKKPDACARGKLPGCLVAGPGRPSRLVFPHLLFDPRFGAVRMCLLAGPPREPPPPNRAWTGLPIRSEDLAGASLRRIFSCSLLLLQRTQSQPSIRNLFESFDGPHEHLATMLACRMQGFVFELVAQLFAKQPCGRQTER